MAGESTGTYQVIARRYRPQTFREVVGQQAAVQQLNNEIRDGRIGHGYLFCGPRGTGKTSMARIFAKALNCVNGPTTEPCGTCNHCQEITAGTHLDVTEVDAATYTKVESTRQLLEGIGRAAFGARYKVYIIDEVHMLSNSSFNALLKSLEEPPPNVVFILATTNPEKIPETVVSRCRRCTFERIAHGDIVRCLDQIVMKEGAKVSDEAERQPILNAISLAADGGLRDAEVLLDQLISLSPDGLSLETVRSLLGVVEGELFGQLLASLVARDTRAGLSLIGDLVDKGRDVPRFVKMFLAYLRDVMLLKAGAPGEMLQVADPASVELREVIDRVSLPFLLNVIQQFLDLEERLRGAAPPRFLMEFTLIKLTAIDPRLVIDPDFGGTPGRGAATTGADSRTVAGPGAGAARASTPSAYLAADSGATAVAEPEPTASIEEIPTTDGDRWHALVEAVGIAQASVRGVLHTARLVEATENRLVIELAAHDRAMKPQLDRPEVVAAFREHARRISRRPLMPLYRVAEPEANLEPVSSDSVDYAAVQDLYAQSDPTPAPAPARKPAPVPAKPPAPAAAELGDALAQFPELAQACALIEEQFGIKPLAYNGRAVQGS